MYFFSCMSVHHIVFFRMSFIFLNSRWLGLLNLILCLRLRTFQRLLLYILQCVEFFFLMQLSYVYLFLISQEMNKLMEQYCLYGRECISMGAVSARTQSLGHLMHRQILRLLVLLKPADFESQSSLLQNKLYRQIQIPNACPVKSSFENSYILRRPQNFGKSSP